MLSLYVQLMKLDFPLGGVVLFAGYVFEPLRKLIKIESDEEARQKCSYLGKDLRFFIWHGDQDNIFPSNSTLDLYNGLFNKLGIQDTIEVKYV